MTAKRWSWSRRERVVGDADVGVLAAIGGQGETVRAEGRGQGLLGGGLAVAARDADEGGGGSGRGGRSGELLKGGQGVGGGYLAPSRGVSGSTRLPRVAAAPLRRAWPM